MSTQRELKFRIWNTKLNKMLPARTLFELTDAREEEVWGSNFNEEQTVFMQYTGLKDRNGREIYEGDVIEFDAREWGNADPKDRRWEVTWDAAEGAWSLGGGSTHTADGCYREVIGNVWENPELIPA